MAKYINDKHGVPLDVMMPVGGNPARIAWLMRYDSLAQWEALTVKLLGDKEYMAMTAKHGETFLPASVHDHIWRKI